MRTINPDEYLSKKPEISEILEILDVRRANDYEDSKEILPEAKWKDPTKIDEWISSIPKNETVVIYCVRGGGVSNSVLDRLLEAGITARYIEGGIEGVKEAGGAVEQK